MGKLRLDINSVDVQGIYSVVDLVFNDTTLVSSKQLSASTESLEYDVEILTDSNNVLKVALLNDKAYDENSDGDFSDASDQTLQARVTTLSYSANGVDFTTLLPQAEVSYTVPSGTNIGLTIPITENVSNFTSFGLDYTLEFNSDGIVNSDYISGVKGKLLENGNFHSFVDGNTYDNDGNVVNDESPA
jgi:hypothetical protein